MRKLRGSISSLAKHFHIESAISTELESIARKEAFEYQTLVNALATIYGYDLLFWAIHPRGIGLLVKARPLKGRGIKSSEMIEAYETIGEVRIAASLKSSSKIKLHIEEHKRLLRYRDNCGDLQRFVQTVKQRISIRYNNKRERTGSVWQDRAKIFPLRNRTDDLLAVTAFILAKAAQETGKTLSLWPSPLQLLTEGDTLTRDRLNQLFKSSRDTAELLDFLNDDHTQIVAQIISSAAEAGKGRGRGQGRGPTPAWRPKCEREQTTIPYNPNVTYKETHERAHRHFHEMLKRYRKFQKETGLDGIPHGYKGDLELRTWASALRGKFKQGRLPQWQLKELEGNSILSPVLTKKKISQAQESY